MSKKENYGPNPILFWILSLITIIALFFIINSPLFNVVSINVYGNNRFSGQEIIDLSGLNYDTNIIKVDERAAKEGIETNPYIKVVDINRTFPCGVEIYVEEREPIAQIPTGNGYYIIDRECTALALIDAKNEGIINIKGIGILEPQFGKEIASDVPEKVDALKNVLKGLNDYSLIGNVSSVDVDDIASTKIVYNNVSVLLGNAHTVGIKLEKLESAYAAVRDKVTEKSVINMETEGGYFLTNR